MGHVVCIVSMFCVASSIGFEIHFPTVAASVAVYTKLMKSAKTRDLLQSPIIIREANAKHMSDVSPVTVLFCFVGCTYLAQYAAKLCANSATVMHVILVCTHIEYLQQYGFVGDGDEAGTLRDHIYCGSASMAGGHSYPIIVLSMTPRRRARMLDILKREYEPVSSPDHWIDIKENIENDASRREYLRTYVDDHFLNRTLKDRAKNKPVRFVPEPPPEPSSEPPSSSIRNRPARRKKARKRTTEVSDEGDGLVARLEALELEVASLKLENARLKQENAQQLAICFCASLDPTQLEIHEPAPTSPSPMTMDR
jgi:hypothetical protein